MAYWHKSRQRTRKPKIEKNSDCKFFHRINPISFEISKIQGCIAQSNKEKLEKEKEAKIKELITLKG